MKYIRTKDGIKEYIGSDKIIITATPEQIEYWQKHLKSVIEKSDWKVGDTIEELCDEFVVEDRDEFAIFHNLKLAKQTKGIIYAAIWTDAGLKYVAKMNDKGELELL